MASQPTIIHVDSDGNSISIPTQTAPTPQISLNTSHIDADGNVIGLNGKLLQGPPPGQGPDIDDVMPTGQQIGTTIAKGLPPLGATIGTALVPEAAPVSGPLGAAAGSQVANILKSYAPKYFSENGQAPSMGEQLSSDAANAGMEGTAQVLGAAAPNLKQGLALAVSKVPGLSGAVERAGLTTEQDAALTKLKNFAKKGGTPGVGVDEPTEVSNILSKVQKDNTVDLNKMDEMFKDPDLRGKISDETKANLRTLGGKLNDLDDKLTPDNPNAAWKNGKLLLRYGTGPLAAHAVGLPWYVGSAVGKAIEIPADKIAQLATNPTTAKALLSAMDKSTPPALANLYRDGLLRAMRGEELMMQTSEGRSKVRIGDQGVPQTERE